MIFTETERLILRKVRPTDLEDYFRDDLTDKTLDRLMCRSSVETEEELRQMFEWFLCREKRAYVIVHKDSGRVIGNLTVYDRVPEFVAAQPMLAGKNGKSLSFALAEPWRRQGLMAEAVRAVMAILFVQEQADYINCGYLSFNRPSELFQRSLGFSKVAEEHFTFEGEALTSIENILTRESWQEGN